MTKMRIGDLAYDKLVEKFMGHKYMKLTESEAQQAIAEVTQGCVSTFAESDVQDRAVNEVQPIPPKRRGRPPGSRNRTKEK